MEIATIENKQDGYVATIHQSISGSYWIEYKGKNGGHNSRYFKSFNEAAISCLEVVFVDKWEIA